MKNDNLPKYVFDNLFLIKEDRLVTYSKSDGKHGEGHFCGYSNDGEYIILGYDDETGCVREFNEKNITIVNKHQTYRFLKPKYVIGYE